MRPINKKKRIFHKIINKHKVGIFIISKLGSKRLRNKAKIKVKNINLIEILIKRLLKELGNKNIIICSSGTKSKVFFKPFKKKYKLKLFFGDNKNVLGRIIKCMHQYNYKHFVRVTGDNPFTDCTAIQKMVFSHLKKQNDYTYTDSLPTGMRPEIFSLNALEKCYNSIISRNSTEYLTYFFLRKDIYKIQNFNFKKNYKNQNRLNISVDYNQDLNLVKKIIKFYKGNIYLERKQIIDFLTKNTKLVKLKIKVPIYCKMYDARYIFDKKKTYVRLN